MVDGLTDRPLRVLVAPDSFKGSLSAEGAARAVAAGWMGLRPQDDLVLLPQADGGEGTLDVIAMALPGTHRHHVSVTGPDGAPILAEWLELPDGTAAIELAQSSGLPSMTRKQPLTATTRGLGEVIRAAIVAGARSLIIGLGGSASTDAGMGALAALGARALNSSGCELPDGGAALVHMTRLDTSDLLGPPPGGATLLTDVRAPLLGPHGAAHVFSPQKGATPAEVAMLETALAAFARTVGAGTGQPGAGAAGGAGYGLSAIWGARIQPGAEYLAALTHLDEQIEHADIVLTGEGSYDGQSATGKGVGRTLDTARRYGVVAGVIAGRVAEDPGVWATSLTALAGTAERALAEPEKWLVTAGRLAAFGLPDEVA